MLAYRFRLGSRVASSLDQTPNTQTYMRAQQIEEAPQTSPFELPTISYLSLNMHRRNTTQIDSHLPRKTTLLPLRKNLASAIGLIESQRLAQCRTCKVLRYLSTLRPRSNNNRIPIYVTPTSLAYSLIPSHTLGLPVPLSIHEIIPPVRTGMIIEFARIIDRRPVQPTLDLFPLRTLLVVLLEVQRFDVVDDGCGRVVGGCGWIWLSTDDVAVMLCTGGAGSLVGGPMGLLAGGAAVRRGSASAASECTVLGTRGVTAS